VPRLRSLGASQINVAPVPVASALEVHNSPSLFEEKTSLVEKSVYTHGRLGVSGSFTSAINSTLRYPEGPGTGWVIFTVGGSFGLTAATARKAST
jgi:hypothetical protein